MAEWKTQMSYNYIPPYHHHPYGLMYHQQHPQAGSGSGSGSEPQHQHPGPHQHHLSGWAVEHRYYPTTTTTTQTTTTTTTGGGGGGGGRPEEDPAVEDLEDPEDSSSPPSPQEDEEQQPQNQNQGHYQLQPHQGVVYHGGGGGGGDAQNQRPYLAPQEQQHQYTTRDDTPENQQHRDADGGGGGGRTPTSDWEPHTSPDSWCSASSREEGIPQADPTSWVKNTDTGSPDDSGIVSSSVLEETQPYETKPTPTPTSASAPRTPRTRNLRTSFSEDQMRVLVQRFNAQWYLTPGEMKVVAVETGLTYRQVKTWFQNRRMKLRKRQKDANSNPTAYHNATALLQQYQGEARTSIHEQYSQQTAEAGDTYKSLAYYLAVVGAAGSAGYPGPWSPRAPLAGAAAATTALPSRPVGLGWPLGPMSANQYHHHHHQQQQQQQPYDYASSYGVADTPVAVADTNSVSGADSLPAARGDGADDGPMYTALL